MERVYLLLRHNQESGPFTIGELLQQQLKPTDMIWIEGKSKAWTYLSELELTPFIAPSLPEQKSTIKGKDEIERKAEELRQRILSSSTTYYAPRVVERESYACPYRLPENEMEFVDHRKERRARRSVVVGELALTSIVIGLFALGIYKGKSFLSERKQVDNSVATKLNTSDEHTAQRKQKPVSVVFVNAPDTTHKIDSSVAIVKPKVKPHLVKQDSVLTQIIPQQNNLSSVAQQPDKKEEVAVPKTTDPTPVIKKDDAVVKKETVASDKKDNAKKTVEEPEEKKKGFFLTNLFKKKKKDKESQDE